MKLSDIVWSNPERPRPFRAGGVPPPWLRTARLDRMHPDGVHRAGRTVDVAWWPDTDEYGISGQPRMGPLEFAAAIREYGCQVRYNEFGEF